MGGTGRFKEQLKRQLGFLHRSCQLFDIGYVDEAIRIATCLRVLFYDKPTDRSGQGSIVKQIGGDSIRLHTTSDTNTPNTKAFVFDGYCNFPKNCFSWEEHLKKGPTLLSVSDWLVQVIFVSGKHRISRRDIILTAANKDGGAHVDSTLTSEYEAVSTMWRMVGRDEAGNLREATLDGYHLLALRRFGLEALNSEELLALADVTSASAISEGHMIRTTDENLPILNRAVDVSTYRFRGDTLAKKGDHLEAEKLYSRAVSLLDEIRVALLIGRGNALIKSNEYRTAVGAFEGALAVDPDHAAALYGSGYALKAIGEMERAEELLKRGAAKHPGHIPIQLSLADLHLTRRDYKAAIEVYDNVLLIDPTNEIALKNKVAADNKLATHNSQPEGA